MKTAMHIDRNRLRLLTAALAISGVGMVACATPAESADANAAEVEEVDTVQQALPVEEGGDGCGIYTSSSTSTSNILPATVCGGALSEKELQARAGAVFAYLVG